MFFKEKAILCGMALKLAASAIAVNRIINEATLVKGRGVWVRLLDLKLIFQVFKTEKCSTTTLPMDEHDSTIA